MIDRAQLIGYLRDQGICEPVLAAMQAVDREAFVPLPMHQRAYEDVALPIDCMQTISQPYTVAFMTQLLDVQQGSKVLEVGTGSGYQAAVLCKLGARVFTIERHAPLLLEARKRFEQLGFNVASKVGDGSIGWSEYAPFDRIIVTAAAPRVPDALVNQLSDGGKLVLPVGTIDQQRLLLITKTGDEIVTREWSNFRFVPLVGKEGWGKG